MEIKNRSGPNIDPCGTPYGTDRESDNVRFIQVLCYLFVKYDLNQSRDSPPTS